MRSSSGLAIGRIAVVAVIAGLATPAWAQSQPDEYPKPAGAEFEVGAPTPVQENAASTGSAGPSAPSGGGVPVASPEKSTPTIEGTLSPVAVDPIIATLLPRLAKAGAALSKDERLALQQTYGSVHAAPIWVADKSVTPRATLLAAELARADDWGLKASDFDLSGINTSDATVEKLAEIELKLSVAVLKYARHARGGRVDPTQLSSYLDRKAHLIAPKRVIEESALAPEPDAYLRSLHPRHPQFEMLRQAYLSLRDTKVPASNNVGAAQPSDISMAVPSKGGKAAKAPPAAPETGSVRKLIANMEMWRWMPSDLGATHLFVNVPEFQFRLIRNDQLVHTERVITGKIQNQTPIFSDMMETVVFKPTWNVPDSIKVKELLPALMRNPEALARQGLRVAYNGREVDAVSINWSSTDIRALHVFQPPGEANALGVVKFLFPNKHAVYLHDTPTKPLFNATSRAFSHGCIRVRNPVRLAEILMEADQSWSPAKVKAQLAPGAVENNETALSRRFPVHIAYFTAWANDAGQMQYFRDVYDYETNIHLGLEGKTHLIAKKKEDNLGAIRAEVVGSLIETRPSSPANRDWMKTIFNTN